jgi:hypothetical protein
MKLYLFVLLFISLLALSLSPQVNAQTSSWNKNASVKSIQTEGQLFMFSGTIDSTKDTLISTNLFFADYDRDTNPGFTFSGLLSGGTASHQKVSIELLGSNTYDGHYTTVDTMLYKDSSITTIYKELTLNSKHYAYYKVRCFGTTGNVLTDFDFGLYLWKKNH